MHTTSVLTRTRFGCSLSTRLYLSHAVTSRLYMPRPMPQGRVEQRCYSDTTSTCQSSVQSDGVAHIWLKRDSRKHPIATIQAMSLLTDELRTAATNHHLRAIFLRTTCAGADLRFMKDLGSSAKAIEFIRGIDKLCSTIQDLRVPVVGVINGPCLGAGMEIAASCDMRISSPKSVFAMPETRVGLPSVVQASLIPGLIGWGRAREMLYFGDAIDAATALQWGFVNCIVEPDDMESKMQEWADRFNRTGSHALNAQKALMRVWEEKGTGRAGVEAGVHALGRAFETNEPATMMQKYFDDRAAMKQQKAKA